MGVVKNALRTRGFAAAGISVACMLAAACLAAGVPCNQVAYASETESQSQTANAQNAQSSGYLYAVQDSETGLWGFVDAAGTQVIPCQFDGIGSVPGEPPQLMITDDSRNPNYKAVSDLPGGVMGDDPFPMYDSDTEKWGYIDKSGEWVIEPRIR
ncbi:WG repeat-containing protein [Slackia isoflavoniconvertens]|uniref:WG repeat-containing protein n=1 Tax=Slackia isoflavoniconvertens TaxID=572010 RepID=UPI003AB999FB